MSSAAVVIGALRVNTNIYQELKKASKEDGWTQQATQTQYYTDIVFVQQQQHEKFTKPRIRNARITVHCASCAVRGFYYGTVLQIHVSHHWPYSISNILLYPLPKTVILHKNKRLLNIESRP